MIKKIIVLILIIALAIGIFGYILMENLFPLKYEEIINAECEKYGFPRDLIYAQIFKESKFEADAESEKGAVGLMQIMPETGKWCAEKMGIPYSEGDLKNPAKSISIGLWYLNYLYEKTGGQNYDFALAAYNGGIANVEKWIADGLTIEQIPFPETNDYVKKINGYRKVYKFLYWKEIQR